MSDYVRLYVQGEAFSKKSYDLRKLELIISNYRQIIDQILPIPYGQKTLTDKLKREIKYEVELNNGSLEVILKFLYEHKEELLMLFAADGGISLPFLISKLIESALDLRRIFAKLLEKGFSPTIVINKNTYNHNDYSIHNDFTNSKIEINNPATLLAAQNSKPPVDRLIEGIDNKSIEDIEIKSDDSKSLLTIKDGNITGKQKQELSSHVELFGRLDMIAFSSHRGSIETGGKKYPVTWDEKLRKKIQTLADHHNIVFKVRPIIDRRRFKEDPIAFHIIDCWDPQGKLEFKKI